MDNPNFSDAETDLKGPIPLSNIFIHVTKACNLLCAYCYFSANKQLPDELTTEEFAPLWPQVVALRPKKVVFTGGEPLLRPDILDLMRALNSADPHHRILRCLNTNGQLVTAAVAQQLVGLADEVRVSVDALQELNDELRGKGSFEAALRALDLFYAAGFEPTALVTVSSLSLPDLEELLCCLIGRSITHIKINPLRPIGRGKGNEKWLIRDLAAVQSAVRRAWERSYPSLRIPDMPADPECQSHCGVGESVNIMPNGDVFPCHVLVSGEFRCGNLRQESFAAICRRNGLLGALANIDFRNLARQADTVAGLTRPGTCMGSVYAATKSDPVWQKNLPLVQLTSGHAG